MKTTNISIIALMMSSLFTSTIALADTSVVDKISQLGVHYRVLDNNAAANGVECAKLGADWGLCNRGVISLNNPGNEITNGSWTIYFHSVREILRVDNTQFKITHVTGDLYSLQPTNQFKGFPARASVDIPIVNEYWQLFESDIMPRWFVTAKNSQPKVIASTNTEEIQNIVSPIKGDLWKSPAGDQNVLMTPESRFAKNSDVPQLKPDVLRGQIVPTPLQVKVHAADVNLGKGVTLDLTAMPVVSAQAIKSRFALLGIQEQAGGYPIKTLINRNLFNGDTATSGAYHLSITTNGATVTGYDSAGAFYGVQSLLSLVPASGQLKIATLDAVDAPRFDYRGVFIDVARNFHTKTAILRTMDEMAAYKLNKLHLHLTDDEGWRIQIPGLPELTDVGSKRAFDLTEKTSLLPQLGSGPDTSTNGSGFFTRQDYIDIIKYAKARQIQVIPEIDMPGHARAAVVSMEARYDRLMKEGKQDQANQYRLLDPTDASNITTVQYYDRRSLLNPCLDSTRNFVDKVIGEISLMHQEAGQPLTTWHFGGDEAKNIRLGGGYTDKNKPEPGKGMIDKADQDKPWGKSEACRQVFASGKVADIEHLPSWFAQEVSQIVKAHGIDEMQAWQDGLKDAKDSHAFATDKVRVNFWDTLFWGGATSVNDWANKGYEVVISNPDYLYLDFPYEVNPSEPGYYWGTRFNDERKIFGFSPNNLPQNAETSVDRDGKPFTAKADTPWPGAYGISAQVWSELVRTDAEMEYRLFPRILSVAERAWHRASWEQDFKQGREYKGGVTHFVDLKAQLKDWVRYANLLGQRELPKLDRTGIAWRLPVPGARIVDGQLQANIALPGLTIEYSQDQGQSWQRYDDAARPRINSPVQIRSVSSDGARSSRVETVAGTF